MRQTAQSGVDSAPRKRQVHKFGGSSLADAACYRRVSEILEDQLGRGDLVVVSAAGKTTNALVALCELGDQQDPVLDRHLADLEAFQHKLIRELLSAPRDAELAQLLQEDMASLRRLLGTTDAEQRYNEVVGFGEIWSARLLSARLNERGIQADWLDSRKCLTAAPGPQPEVDMQSSAQRSEALLTERGDRITIVTGFIARCPDGNSVTLGRNGSDYSATALGALAGAASVTIWTDVAGVFSADPNKVDGAATRPILSLNEASELARLGSPVLHTRTLQPLRQRKMRLTIRSTFSVQGNHTQIAPTQVGERGAKIITSLDKVCVISLRTDAGQAFDQSVNTIRSHLDRYQLLPLAKHYQPDQRMLRLCFTAEVAKTAFARLRDFQVQGAFSDLSLVDNYSLIAMVGEGVTENARHYHCFYRQLQDAPVEFIQPGEQGSSLLAVLRETNLDQLLSHLHHGIASPDKRIGIALFGAGNVGSGWLELYREQQHHLANAHRCEVQLCGVISKEGALLDFKGIDPSRWQARFSEAAENLNFDEILDLLAAHPYDELVVLDTTDSHTFSEQYPLLIEQGFHLISANKYPASAPLSLYREISQQLDEKACHWFNNATVGANLPINYVVRDLRQSGDQIESISGILSGSFSWLLGRFDGTRPFSELVLQALDQGYTEPDPREDLTGEDVRRKLLILAREIGAAEMELDDIEYVSLLPEELHDLDLEQFLSNMELLDQKMQKAYVRAKADDLVLCHVARISRNGAAHVGLEYLPPDDPLAMVTPGENIYAINSERYDDEPLVVRGPAVGPELTAGALQSDLFHLFQKLRSS